LPDKNQKKSSGKISLKLMSVSLNELFDLHSGDYHNASELPIGNIPLVSCGDINNGVMMLCSVPLDMTYRNALTIAYNGSWPLLTKYHPYTFAAKDDVAVCIPKEELLTSTLIFIQQIINRQTWRYSYGRKCFKHKLEKMKICVPVNTLNKIDEPVIANLLENISYWNFLNQWKPTNSAQEICLP